MQLELNREGATLTAYLIGELDHHAAGDLRNRIDTAALSCRCKRLILDLGRLTFMDSSGIGLMMGRYRLVQSLGGQLTVVGASPRIREMIRLAGLDALPIWDKPTERTNANETR